MGSPRIGACALFLLFSDLLLLLVIDKSFIRSPEGIKGKRIFLVAGTALSLGDPTRTSYLKVVLFF